MDRHRAHCRRDPSGRHQYRGRPIRRCRLECFLFVCRKRGNFTMFSLYIYTVRVDGRVASEGAGGVLGPGFR